MQPPGPLPPCCWSEHPLNRGVAGQQHTCIEGAMQCIPVPTCRNAKLSANMRQLSSSMHEQHDITTVLRQQSWQTGTTQPYNRATTTARQGNGHNKAPSRSMGLEVIAAFGGNSLDLLRPEEGGGTQSHTTLGTPTQCFRWPNDAAAAMRSSSQTTHCL